MTFVSLTVTHPADEECARTLATVTTISFTAGAGASTMSTES